MSYRIAVRALCEFAAKRGDLDLRFTPSPSAQEGIAGHQLVGERRGERYEREIALSGAYRHLEVRGRADGYDPDANRLEEIKTHRGDLSRQPANQRALHWAQAKMYGHLLCAERGLDQLTVTLVYFDIVSQRETPLSERCSAEALRAEFDAHCQAFLAWAQQELAHRRRRDHALQALRFPYAGFREGQRPLAESVYKAIHTRRWLMLQAPTGIGKTLGTLFPMLKAMPGEPLDKIFFLTARNTGQRLALDALRTLGAGQRHREIPEPEHPEPGDTGSGSAEPDDIRSGDSRLGDVQAVPLRVLTLTSRDKSCEHPDKACHGESCPLAAGFYDRLPAARRAAVERGWLDRAALRETALAHEICPYYLGQEMARWADVVIGDVNYWFDFHAMLYALSQQQQWRVGLLVDEAHNLVERGRGMYSATLDHAAFRRLKPTLPAPLKRPFSRVASAWRALADDSESDYRVLETLPGKLIGALQQAVSQVVEYQSEQPIALDSELQRFAFDAQHFCRVADVFGDHSICDVSRQAPRGRQRQAGARVTLRNVVPAPFLTPRFAAAQGGTLFSATLAPEAYYRDLLGVPDDAPWMSLASPFRDSQLEVRIAARLSTRYADREASLTPLADRIAVQFRACRGNYLAFFSSFAYLEQVADRLAERHPEVPIWRQASRMDDDARETFLSRFEANGEGVGFAVLGGIFGEGIDLPGDRLIGAFVATLGLPQINPVNEQMRARLQALYGHGYDYAYFFPGMQKVVQAAGRVIRSGTDEGVIHLLDDRFARRESQALLPDWWPKPIKD
ncbi:ATP-dependent DNA helicase [Salinicola sp. MIT1003]|uniref:ATP-dependent DNA helicase n=1 Tax=Salinicola sp. MIT1003 TaxID=1882734 RepID=UPI0008DD0EB6|nr:ATP-dependent DNA helicase [Salinicola sp. MIT1003]OHZ03858.1 ATP-dependent DNA helicase [Salinicola sp. MIT1003]